MSWTYNPLRPCPIGHWRCGRFLWQGPFGSFCWWGFGSLNFDNLRFRRADWLLNYLVWWCCFQNGTMISMTAIFLCLFSTFWREEATPFSLSLFLSLSLFSLSQSVGRQRDLPKTAFQFAEQSTNWKWPNIWSVVLPCSPSLVNCLKGHTWNLDLLYLEMRTTTFPISNHQFGPFYHKIP